MNLLRRIPLIVTTIVGVVTVGTGILLIPIAENAGGQTQDALPDARSEVIELGAPGSSVLYLTTVTEHSRVGLLRQEYPFTLATIEIPTGRYALGYQFEAHYSGALRGLECEIVEATSLLSVGPQEASRVSVSMGWESYSVNSRLDLPEMTIALSCRANQTGLSDTRFREVSMFALRLR